jgi:hypothetical protein
MVAGALSFDGSRRTEFAVVPHRALARGPVWVISEIRGACYFRAAGASITRGGETLLLRCEDGHTVEIPTSSIMRYQSVTVVEPERSYRPELWRDVAPGTRLTFVWVLFDDFD